MKKTLGLACILILAAVPAMAQKITIDYAHDFDFDAVKTFEYRDTPDSNVQNDMMAGRIVTAIVRELTEGGLQRVESDGDIIVTYHVTTAERTSYNTTSMGYGGYGGWGAGWGGWGTGGMGTSTTYETNYTDGTLIIDGYNPADKKLVWRATGTVTVKAKPEKQIKQIDNVLKKIGNKWDKILEGKGK
jgi:hypothetical protein